MGQAKKRGTFEQRRQLAIERNTLLEMEIARSKNPEVQRLTRKHGIQRIACSLIATGMIHHLRPPEPEKPKLILPPRYANRR